MKDLLSYFGEMLINEVRDRTIRGFDMRITGKMKDESSKKLFEKVQQMSDEQRLVIEKIIPQIVDLSIHNMLCMIEENANIDMQVENEIISELSDGLAGELYTEDGWIQRFSKQRYEEI
ncbi:MAG: epimerase [Lachnospiraceae bacterium]|nr:epimerase [Lachnospiraceae bacterium]